MTDYALVLNAGSSSLKFCVYRVLARRAGMSVMSRPHRGHDFKLRPARRAAGRAGAAWNGRGSIRKSRWTGELT
jgi:hypothetical protein